MHSYQVGSLTSGCMLITLQIILPGNVVMSTPGGAVILLFWSWIRGKRSSEFPILDAFTSNRIAIFLHDYINKHIFYWRPASQSAQLPCLKWPPLLPFQRISEHNPAWLLSNTLVLTLSRLVLLWNCGLLPWLQSKMMETKKLLRGCRYCREVYFSLLQLIFVNSAPLCTIIIKLQQILQQI